MTESTGAVLARTFLQGELIAAATRQLRAQRYHGSEGAPSTEPDQRQL